MKKKKTIQIYSPEPRLSSLDKQLIRLLVEILIEDQENSSGNRSIASVPLSDHQAEQLLLLLAELLTNKKFLASLSYVDHVTSQERLDSDSKRTVQKLRSAANKNPILYSEAKFNDFKARLGVEHRPTGIEPLPMTFEHFLRMERRLIEHLHIDDRVVSLIMSAASKHEHTLREILRATSSLKPVGKRPNRLTLQVRRFYNSLVERFETDFDLTVGRDQLVGLITVVSNTTVIFTSRDWDTAGTMSTICGGLSLALPLPRN